MATSSSASRSTMPPATLSPSRAAANTTGVSPVSSPADRRPKWIASVTWPGRRSPKNAGTSRSSEVAGPRPSRPLMAAASPA
jgi:hypothetical protein